MSGYVQRPTYDFDGIYFDVGRGPRSKQSWSQNVLWVCLTYKLYEKNINLFKNNFGPHRVPVYGIQRQLY